jgi:hypothetical protein
VANLKAEKIVVRISRDLYEKVRLKIECSDLKLQSADEYVGFVLREFVEKSDVGPKSPYSKEDQEQIKRQLKNLGYL